jgi:hypothetical protein
VGRFDRSLEYPLCPSANSSDNLVVNSLGGQCQLLRGWLPLGSVAKDNHLVAYLDLVVSNIQDELVHGDSGKN